MATYAIGDIQGCYQSLQNLLNKIQFNPKQDKLWLVGDLINRGPESLKTLRFLYQHRDAVQCVLGNHDLHFLAVDSGVKQATRKDTFESLLKAKDREELVAWLKQQPLFHYSKKHNIAMVHAGVPPCWSLKKTRKYAKEVSECIQSDQAEEFFAAMYGNTPTQWSKNLSGMTRLRVITNFLTRMRYCLPDGSLELTQKVAIGQQPSQLTPWFELERKPLGCELIFGHWASLEGRCFVDDIFAIDTGCVWGGLLTALRLEDKTYFHVKSAELKQRIKENRTTK